MAERFDNDPFLIFKLRGRTREEISLALREKRTAGAAEDAAMTSIIPASISAKRPKPLEECLNTFWLAGSHLTSLEIKPKGPDVENAVLKRLGDAPFSIGKANMTTFLSKAYAIAGRAALAKMQSEAEDREQN